MVLCDCSQNGIGAVVLRNGRPMGFHSRIMAEAGKECVETRKEFLVVAFALGSFPQYTFGRRTVVQTYNKLIMSIANKPINEAAKDCDD